MWFIAHTNEMKQDFRECVGLVVWAMKSELVMFPNTHQSLSFISHVRLKPRRRYTPLPIELA